MAMSGKPVQCVDLSSFGLFSTFLFPGGFLLLLIKYHTPAPTPQSPGRRGGATARSALGWYKPSVGVPRDVGCRRCIRVATALTYFQFSSDVRARHSRHGLVRGGLGEV